MWQRNPVRHSWQVPFTTMKLNYSKIPIFCNVKQGEIG